MQRKALRRYGAVVCLLCATVSGRAQTSECQTVRVELKGDSEVAMPQYTLELYDVRSHQKIESAEIQADGAFTLRHVPYGDYQLTVVDGARAMIHQEFVSISGATPSITIQLLGLRKVSPPGGGVTVQQLQHPPSKKALQAMLTAQKDSAAGNFEKAADELEKAVQLSPYFAEAYTNLAAQHIRLGRYQQATAELTRAIEIGGPNPIALTNLAVLQLNEEQVSEAEKSARWALRLDPGYPQAEYILQRIAAQSLTGRR